MVFRSFQWNLLLRIGLLLLTLSLPALVIAKGWPEILVFLVPVIVYQVLELFNFLKKAQDELVQFIDSVHNRDFSRHFDARYTSAQFHMLRKGFNEITTTLKNINREKESQHLHLQKIMELVNTGILSYDTGSGEIVLMNESLKKLLHIPFMKHLQHLEKRDLELYQDIQQLEPGHSKISTAYTSHFEKSPFKVLLSATTFTSDGKTYKLVSFQNINDALDETESKAWQKLLNVLTHEIMNSVAPIASLADTLKNRLQEVTANGPTIDDLDDFEVGVSTIKSRSLGLLRFAETYRNLNKITKLNLIDVSVKDVYTNLKHLLLPTLTQKNIQLEITLATPDMQLLADRNLLDQVLINLLMNAMEAVKNQPNPKITLSAYVSADQKRILKISDNGTGMSREVQEKAFIPFFSSKKNGSGIGLSLCKQIVMLHHGSITIKSAVDEGTTFILQFN
ncbi:sensor histidine kinase [Pontibacter sp. MBLB2868]|uniref:sensor histidine kinase n=1 Tax=Pontibacter sp. MBLB2868 TaxID=3451555 RepID=UPI003F7524B7